MATNTVMFWFWKHGRKVSWMRVNAVYLNCIVMSTFCSEIINIPFRFWLHYLLSSQRKWLHNHIHEWNWQLCEQTQMHVCINCQILTGGNQNIWMVPWVINDCQCLLPMFAAWTCLVDRHTFAKWFALPHDGHDELPKVGQDSLRSMWLVLQYLQLGSRLSCAFFVLFNRSWSSLAFLLVCSFWPEFMYCVCLIRFIACICVCAISASSATQCIFEGSSRVHRQANCILCIPSTSLLRISSSVNVP